MIEGGLNLLPQDDRDFSLGALFKRKRTLPREFMIGEFALEDQRVTDFCTGFVVTSASELQEEVELSPEWQFAKTKQLSGNHKTWGADLRMACKSAVKFGSVEKKFVSFSVENKDRDFLADFKNWPAWLDDKAKIHRKKSFFSVESNFKAIQEALYLRKAVMTGIKWRHSWGFCKDGIIPEVYSSNGVGHAIALIGWKVIENKTYLIAKLSNGNIGDNGKFYLSEEIVNKEIGRYGVFCFIDIPEDEIKESVIKKSIFYRANIFKKVWLKIKSLFNGFF